MLADKTHSRPSELYAVRDEIAAFCFDRAVFTFGTSLEDRLRKVTEKEKNEASARLRAERELQRWLSSADPQEERHRGRFRDPLSGGSRA